MAAYEDALTSANELKAPPTTQDMSSRDEDENGPAPSVERSRDGPKPRTYMWRSIQDYQMSELVRLVRWIESDGILRTEEELLREVMDELGLERRGRRVVARITAAIHEARR